MATLYFTQENDIPQEIDMDPSMPFAKFESFEQEQLASPHSTEYTDDNCETLSEIKRSTSESQKIFEDIISEEEEKPKMSELKDWSEKKDKILKNLASKCKYDWKKIAKKFNASENTEWTALDLKQKYKDLNKVVIPLRVKFTHQEDLMIAKYFDTYGCDWSQIASHFTDRTAMMLKNRYYSHIRKRDLLNSMLEEVNGKSISTSMTSAPTQELATPIETAVDNNIETGVESDIEPQNENYEFDFTLPSSSRLINFNLLNFNNPFLEFEDSFQNILHDRITLYDY